MIAYDAHDSLYCFDSVAARNHHQLYAGRFDSSAFAARCDHFVYRYSRPPQRAVNHFEGNQI